MNDRETSPTIELAEKHLSKRKNIANALGKLKEKPEVLDNLEREFDQAIGTLNSLLQEEEVDPMLKNIALVKERIGEEAIFPTIVSLKETKQLGTAFAIQAATAKVNQLMKAGEKGETIGGDAMAFHQDITNPEELAADVLIEAYGQFCQRLERFKGLKRTDIVLAFEETLGYKHQDSHLWQFIKPWVLEEEGFSPEFVAFTQEEPKSF
jgi:hypothetical protein